MPSKHHGNAKSTKRKSRAGSDGSDTTPVSKKAISDLESFIDMAEAATMNKSDALPESGSKTESVTLSASSSSQPQHVVNGNLQPPHIASTTSNDALPPQPLQDWLNKVTEKLDTIVKGQSDLKKGLGDQKVSIDGINKSLSDQSVSIEELKKSYAFLDSKLDEALTSNTLQKVEIKSLTEQVQTLQCENKNLTRQINDSENYSRKNNLIFLGIPETSNETFGDLMMKLDKLMIHMQVDTSSMKLDNIHRLPGRVNQRPVIIKFCSNMDKQMVWNNRSKASGYTHKVTIKEHYSKTTENNIKILLPIKRAAVLKGMRATLNGDKLKINGNVYSIDTIGNLPHDLQPEQIATKVIDNHLFFYSKQSKLSNFHRAKFMIDGVPYICTEQYIHKRKADLFHDPQTGGLIMEATTPERMLYLSRQVNGFNQQAWDLHSQTIGYEAVLAKFQQNPDLKTYLLSTKPLKLVEASPVDKKWGIGYNMADPNIMKEKKNWGLNEHGQNLERVRSELT
jgi:ribA/ribD-fused uncharacterized protein